MTEGKHLGRTIRWSPQGFEWESNSKHVEDMVELCGLKLGSKEFYGIVRAVATSKQTSQILEQIGMQSEVTIASDSSSARGICTKTGSGKVRHLLYTIPPEKYI